MKLIMLQLMVGKPFCCRWYKKTAKVRRHTQKNQEQPTHNLYEDDQGLDEKEDEKSANAMEMGQFERTLTVADDRSFVEYLEECTVPSYHMNQLDAAVVELHCNEEAEIKYLTVQIGTVVNRKRKSEEKDILKENKAANNLKCSDVSVTAKMAVYLIGGVRRIARVLGKTKMSLLASRPVKPRLIPAWNTPARLRRQHQAESVITQEPKLPSKLRVITRADGSQQSKDKGAARKKKKTHMPLIERW
ncbi:UPF0051 protein ABCI8, chloroplastic [Tanacetum coccineum]